MQPKGCIGRGMMIEMHNIHIPLHIYTFRTRIGGLSLMYGAEMDGYVSGNNDQQIYYIISEAANKVIVLVARPLRGGGDAAFLKLNL